MSEHNFSEGFALIGLETTPGTAVKPTVQTPVYDYNMAMDPGLISDAPATGLNFARLQMLQGVRKHSGTLTVMCEPNTLNYWLAIFGAISSPTGSGPYVRTLTHGNTAPQSATLDVSLGSQIERWIGVEAGKLTFSWNGEKLELSVDLVARKSFLGREIASISTTTVVLKTDYDPNPSDGLVATDTVWVAKADGSVTPLSTTVSSITNGTTVVLGASAAAFAAGDMLLLRPVTPALATLTPFVWGNTRFYFGSDLTAALAASHTPLEPGTQLVLTHDFADKQGSPRSGSFDPQGLPRVTYDVDFKGKKFFDTSADIRTFNSRASQAVVMRAFTGSTNQYELKVALNASKISARSTPGKSQQVIYSDLTFMQGYNQSDGTAFTVTNNSAIASL